MNDRKLVRWLLLLLLLPLGLAMCSNDGDQFRYPCQNPTNWDKPVCQKPLCDVTRTCPEHVFKGQRDPKSGLPDDQKNNQLPQGPTNCGK